MIIKIQTFDLNVENNIIETWINFRKYFSMPIRGPDGLI